MLTLRTMSAILRKKRILSKTTLFDDKPNFWRWMNELIPKFAALREKRLCPKFQGKSKKTKAKGPLLNINTSFSALFLTACNNLWWSHLCNCVHLQYILVYKYSCMNHGCYDSQRWHDTYAKLKRIRQHLKIKSDRGEIYTFFSVQMNHLDSKLVLILTSVVIFFH